MVKVDRIRELCSDRGISLSRLERELGMGKSLIIRWENQFQPNQKSLQRIADYFGVSVAYLMGETEDPETAKGVSIPVLGTVSAGLPISAVEDILDYEEISKDMASKGEYFGLQIKGDSMYPRILEGDVVIVKVQNYAENGDIVIAQVNGDEATCKKYLVTPTGLTLQPLNPDYKPIEYSIADVMRLPVRIIGKVVELRGKL